MSVRLPRNASGCVTRVEQALYMRGERRVMRGNETKWENATLGPGGLLSVAGLAEGKYDVSCRAGAGGAWGAGGGGKGRGGGRGG